MNSSQLSGFELVSTEMIEIIKGVNNSLLGALIGTFGLVSNIINIDVFLKQGFKDNVNISLLALSISDFGSLITMHCVNLLWNPLFVRSGVPLVPDEVMYLSGGWPHGVFVKISSWITVFITFERCLCVMMPLKVKRVITHKRTVIVILCIYTLMFITLIPEIATSYIGWKFYPERNQTLVGLVIRGNRGFVAVLSFLLSAVTQVLSLFVVTILTILLVVSVKRKSKWRLSSAGNVGRESVTQKRDNKTIKMVIYVAVIFIICIVPSVINFALTTSVPECVAGGKYQNAFLTGWSFATLIETVNASVNIFIYYNMSTKYKTTFHTIFSGCKCCEKNKEIEQS